MSCCQLGCAAVKERSPCKGSLSNLHTQVSIIDMNAGLCMNNILLTLNFTVRVFMPNHYKHLCSHCLSYIFDKFPDSGAKIPSEVSASRTFRNSIATNSHLNLTVVAFQQMALLHSTSRPAHYTLPVHLHLSY